MCFRLFQSGPVPFEIEEKRDVVVGPLARHNLTGPSSACGKNGDFSPATGQTTRDSQTSRELLTLSLDQKKVIPAARTGSGLYWVRTWVQLVCCPTSNTSHALEVR